MIEEIMKKGPTVNNMASFKQKETLVSSSSQIPVEKLTILPLNPVRFIFASGTVHCIYFDRSWDIGSMHNTIKSNIKMSCWKVSSLNKMKSILLKKVQTEGKKQSKKILMKKVSFLESKTIICPNKKKNTIIANTAATVFSTYVNSFTICSCDVESGQEIKK